MSKRLESVLKNRMPSAMSDGFHIRSLEPSDSIHELTHLLHRAYKTLLDMGLHYVATHQSEEITRARIAGGDCVVAVVEDRIVGTVTYHRHTRWKGSPWMQLPEVAWVSQLAVEPEFQKQGIGSALMERVEHVARDEGASEIGLSTAEPATHLIEYYRTRGYRFIEYTDDTLSQGYRSVILSKALEEV